MKTYFSQMKMTALAVVALLILASIQSLAQDFQRVFGTSFDNSFSKVIQDGTSYFVLGQDEVANGAAQRATVTRLNANGIHQWTLSLGFASVWNDAVLISPGELLVVGATVPNPAVPGQSLIGRVTTTGGGNFSWLKDYDLPGNEGFTRVVKNPVPQNAAFPYYVLGYQNQAVNTPTVDDVVLLNLDANGNFNWKKRYAGAGDDEYYRDMEALPNGDLLIAGNGTSGLIFQANNAGVMLNGVQIGSPQLVFKDVARALIGDIYAVANTLSGQAHLMKFDGGLFLQWDVQIPALSSVSQVWEGFFGEIYVTGRGNFGGTDRDVVIKLLDTGTPAVTWVKYPNTGNGFIGGSSWWLNSAQIAFTDARSVPGGFGQNCAFISVSDPEMATCAVSETFVDLVFSDPVPDGPVLPSIDFHDILPPTNLQVQAVNWLQKEVCNTNPCTAEFTFSINCGVVTFTDQSTVPGTPSWSWTFPGGTPLNSTAQNPTTTYPVCGTYQVCLTATGSTPFTSCNNTVCHTVVIEDTTKPNATCKQGAMVVLDANCMATISPTDVAASFSDNCAIVSTTVSPNTFNTCGFFDVVLTVTDWCGNFNNVPCLLQLKDNTLPVIVCPQNQTISLANTWQPVGIPGFSVGTAHFPSLAFSGSTPYVAFRDDSHAFKATVMKFDGTNWVYVGTPGFSAGALNETSLAFSGTTPYVAILDALSGGSVTVMKFDGTNWVNVGTPGFSGPGVDFPSLAFSGTTPYLAFRDAGGIGSKATVMKFDGTNWVYVGAPGFSAPGMVSISLAFSGTTPYVAYEDGAFGLPKATVMKFDGANWVNVGTPGFSAGHVQSISLAFSGSTPYVAYSDGGNSYKATAMKFDGINWVNVGTPGFSAGIAGYTWLALSGTTPYVAFQDNASGGEATVMKFDGFNWVNVGNTGFSAGQSYLTAISFSGPVPYVAYLDGANGNNVTVMNFAPCDALLGDWTNAAITSDNCTASGNISVTQTPPASTVMSCNNAQTVVLTADDGKGNTASCSFTVTLKDNTPPTITCPPNQTVTGTIGPNGQCMANVQVTSPTATDNCDPTVSLSNSFNGTANASGTYPNGNTTVTWTATDNCGNSATCSMMVTVECDPTAFPGFKCGQAVVTCFSGSNPGGHVMGIIDVRDYANPIPSVTVPAGTVWQAPMYSHPDWTSTKMGEVFGIAIDNSNNIYVAATKAYTGSDYFGNVGLAGTGGIYKISSTTGAVTPFVTTLNNPAALCGAVVGTNNLPNASGNGPGLGNICFDPAHGGTNGQFFVTNLEDGKIYRVDDAGTILSCFDPFLAAATNDGIECLGELLWGVGYHANRVYFGVWNNDAGLSGSVKNMIYSVGLNAAGDFLPATLQWEITLQDYYDNWLGQLMTNPISDIEFSHDGKMLVAERSMMSSLSPCMASPWSHSSRVMEYVSLVGGGWNQTPKRFYMGNFNAPDHANASGGVDYGYQGIDQTTGNVFGCDSMVWATNDAMIFDWVDGAYGIAGTPASGNTPAALNNVYVDADNDISNSAGDDKTRIGDVDIFKCGCPEMGNMPNCDSTLTATATQVFPHGEPCCWSIDMNINEPSICRIEFESITPGVIFNQFVASTWSINVQTPGTLISITDPPGDIPLGLYPNAVRFCLTNITQAPPQKVVIRYFKTTPNGTELLFCKDTLEFNCDPPNHNNGCWSAVVDTVYCNQDSQSYTIKLLITNEDDAETWTQLGILGVSPAACFSLGSPSIIPLNPPLGPGQTTTTPICLTINTSKFISDTTNVYFNFFLFNDQACCHATDSLCVPLPPCCSPCENAFVEIDSIASQFDSCCYTMDVHNGCAKNYFKRIETEILTPGVTFSQATVVNNPPLIWNATGSPTQLNWIVAGGFIPVGDFPNMMNFCLKDINDLTQYPQCVEIRWIACNENGMDTVVCRDTLKFYCPPVKHDSCIEVIEQDITCLPDGSYQYNYTIQNITTHFASNFVIYDVLPPFTSANVNPFPVNVPVNLNPGGTYSGSLNITGGLPGDVICLKARLFDFRPPYDSIWCCFDTICITLPPCDSCVCFQDSVQLTGGGVTYTVPCNLHGAPAAVFGCPVEGVGVQAFFGCKDPVTGEVCQTDVWWELQKPGS
ncbi:MAG: HYR domain-containing protein, partial [Bacteroidetes bacterium]|nr:HYR domain-containing protein [Bacteroidota bacterium]